jgi:hypothetical protein
MRPKVRREMPVIGSEYPSRCPPHIGGFVAAAGGNSESGAFLSCWLASSIHIMWLSIGSYVLAAITAIVGSVMTFRDYSF